MAKKVFFYYTARIHNAYRQMIANPPDGFEITASDEMAYDITGTAAARKGGFGTAAAQALRKLQPHFSQLYNRLHIELGRPKVRKFDADGYDLVHSGQSILDTNVPYVMDFEHAAVLSGYNQYAFRKTGFTNALKRLLLNRNLKKIIPWTNAARDSLLNFVKDRELEDKTEVVYLVITPPPALEKKKHGPVNFLFVGRTFYEKGGYDALLAFERMGEKYDATLTVVSNIPEEVRTRFGSNPKIRLISQPYERLNELYSRSDVFIFPTHYDTFGFVIPEAFSFGLPVISVDSFSTPELVEHEKTGLIVKSSYSSFADDRGYAYPTIGDLSKGRQQACRRPDEGYIGELSKAMERLIQDDSLRRRLAANARKETLEGKFSPGVWKGKMGKIYKEALESAPSR